MDSITLKTCFTCRQTKDVSAFCVRRSNADGLNANCKVCRRTYRREWNAKDAPRARALYESRRIVVQCSDCEGDVKRSPQGLSAWAGRCRSCAQIVARNLPEVRAKASINARAQVIRQGGIPNRRVFTSEMVRGSANPKWKGGITPQNKAERSHKPNIEWRKLVFLRDKFTCQLCGQIGGNLNAHHIKPWAEFRELRSDVNNGITLCHPCHFNKVHQGDWHKPGLPIGDTWAMVSIAQ